MRMKNPVKNINNGSRGSGVIDFQPSVTFRYFIFPPILKTYS